MKLPDFLPTKAVLATLETAPVGYALVDAQTYQVVWSNRVYRQQTAHISDSRITKAALKKAQNAKDRAEIEFRCEPSGADCGSPPWLSARPIESEGGPLLFLTLTQTPGSPHGAVTRDSLTGLADRGALDRRLAALPPIPSAGWPPLTLLFIDLDGFKQINDQHGHVVGDNVITAVARRIAAAVRGDDFLARYGGDEFVIVADGLRPGERLDLLVQRIRSAAEEPVETDLGRLTLSASIGVAYSGEGFSTPRDMLAAADERMYADKRQSRSSSACPPPPPSAI